MHGCRRRGVSVAPAESVDVVELAFGWVGKKFVGGYYESVAFKADIVRDGNGGGACVRVVELDELIEAVFLVWCGFGNVEDLIWRGVGLLGPFRDVVSGSGGCAAKVPGGRAEELEADLDARSG